MAEDNKINQKLALKFLKTQGHTISVAENGVQVLEMLEQGNFDLVLMDVQMPVMDGLTATQRIREGEMALADRLGEQVRRIPVIAMTAHAMKGDREKAIDSGMDDYISKPIESEKLAETIHKWGGRGFAAFEPEPVQNQSNDLEKNAQAPVIDLNGAMERVAGDEALLKELFEYFVSELPNRIADMEAAVNSGDTKQLAEKAHSLKGSAANLGTNGIAAAALQLEQQGRSGDTTKAARTIKDLQEQIERFKIELKKIDWRI